MAFPGLKADYPQLVNDETGVRRVYVYLAPLSSLTVPGYKTIYEGHPVDRASMQTVDVSNWGELTIETLEKAPQLDDDAQVTDTPEGSDGDITEPPAPTSGPAAQVENDQYPFYEIEWVQLEKALRQHPAFAEFTPTDWTAIDLWEKETDVAARAAFQYWNRDKEGLAVGDLQTLGASAEPDKSPQVYAKLRLLGVESFLEFAPVARKTSRYRGNSAPATDDAGTKVGSDPFDGVPADYEWLKTADRSSKQGFGIEWLRQEEWTGAVTILLDKREVFIS